jgi:hypothetical protein
MPSIRRKPRPRPLLRPGPDRVCFSQTIRRPHPVVGSCSLFDPTRLSSSTGGAMPRGRIQQGRFVLVRTGEMGTGSRSPRSVPVPISPVLTRGVGKGGQARAEYVPSQSPFPDRIRQPCQARALRTDRSSGPRGPVSGHLHRPARCSGRPAETPPRSCRSRLLGPTSSRASPPR